MANLHRVRDTLLSAYVCDILDDEEFMLLYDINAPSNPDFQYENDGYRFIALKQQALDSMSFEYAAVTTCDVFTYV